MSRSRLATVGLAAATAVLVILAAVVLTGAWSPGDGSDRATARSAQQAGTGSPGSRHGYLRDSRRNYLRDGWDHPTAAEILDEVGRLPSGYEATVHQLMSGGHERYYLEVAPTDGAHLAAGTVPLYVVLHGHHMTPASMERMTDFPRWAEHALLVYPAGAGESWNAGGCCWFAHHHDVNDVAFISSVVKQVLAQSPEAASHRVYAVGFSNGGRMAYRPACDLPGTFAAMAAVEAVPVTNCDHLDPLDIELVARAHDPLLRFGHEHPLTLQGYREPTVTDAVSQWEHLDGCSGTPLRRLEGRAELTTWDHCRDGTWVQYVLYPGAGHLWTWSHPPTPSATDLILSRLGHDLAS